MTSTKARKPVSQEPWRLLMTLLLLAAATSTSADTIGAERSNVLLNLLYQDCGSCHGMRLTGGLGPALTPNVMQQRSLDYLISVIRDGRPNTPMPPWKGLLSNAEISWLANYLQTQEALE